MSAESRAQRLAELQDWEGDEDIPKVSRHAIDQARVFLMLTGSEPGIFPTYTGGIQLEWVTDDKFMSIEFFSETDPERLDGEVYINVSDTD